MPKGRVLVCRSPGLALWVRGFAETASPRADNHDRRHAVKRQRRPFRNGVMIAFIVALRQTGIAVDSKRQNPAVGLAHNSPVVGTWRSNDSGTVCKLGRN